MLAASVFLFVPGADIMPSTLVAAEVIRGHGDRVPTRWPSGPAVELVAGDASWATAWRPQRSCRNYVRCHACRSRRYTVVEALGSGPLLSKQVPGSKSATMCVGSLTSGEFQYCTCRTPATAAGDRGRECGAKVEPPAGPLGSGTGFPVRSEVLNIGDAILLTLTAWIERPGRPLEASTAEFRPSGQHRQRQWCFASHAPHRPIDRLCSNTLNCCCGPIIQRRDIQLAMQRRAPTPPLHITLDA